MAAKNTLSGRLNKIVTIEQPIDSIDPSGAPIITYSLFIRRYASIVPLNGSEFFASQQLTANISLRFRLRFDSKAEQITPKHRVVWNKRTYDIQAVINPMQANKEILLMCEETK